MEYRREKFKADEKEKEVQALKREKNDLVSQIKPIFSQLTEQGVVNKVRSPF